MEAFRLSPIYHTAWTIKAAQPMKVNDPKIFFYLTCVQTGRNVPS